MFDAVSIGVGVSAVEEELPAPSAQLITNTPGP